MINVSEVGSEDGRILEWMDRFTAAKGTETDVTSIFSATDSDWNMLDKQPSIKYPQYQSLGRPQFPEPPSPSLAKNQSPLFKSCYLPCNYTDSDFLESPRKAPIPNSRKIGNSSSTAYSFKEVEQLASTLKVPETIDTSATQFASKPSKLASKNSKTRRASNIRNSLFGSSRIVSRIKIMPLENPVHMIHVSYDPETDQFNVSLFPLSFGNEAKLATLLELLNRLRNGMLTLFIYRGFQRSGRNWYLTLIHDVRTLMKRSLKRSTTATSLLPRYSSVSRYVILFFVI